jgi:hypothetical protein
VTKTNVSFKAHKKVKRPVEVEFTKKDGEKVDFIAKKPVEVAVRVKFKANKK